MNANNNIFNGQQNNTNGFYPAYGYQQPVQMAQMPDVPPYLMRPNNGPSFIKGRPVSSVEEARVAQIDLDGSIFFFPDLGNKKIYTKKINTDGTATLNCYSLDMNPINDRPEYASKEEVAELKAILNGIVEKLKGQTTTPNVAESKKMSF
jgi:hypothetical protein